MLKTAIINHDVDVQSWIQVISVPSSGLPIRSRTTSKVTQVGSPRHLQTIIWVNRTLIIQIAISWIGPEKSETNTIIALAEDIVGNKHHMFRGCRAIGINVGITSAHIRS